jgi:flagellar biosynthetic protein FlhB
MPDANKTEQATPQRRKDARAQGQIARSREFPSVLAMTGAVGALILMAPTAVLHWTGYYRSVLDQAASGNIDANGPVLFWSTIEVFRWMTPVLCAALALSVLAGLAQGGMNIAPEALAPKPERLNPAEKLSHMFSIAGLNQLLKSLIPFGFIAWAGWATLASYWLPVEHAASLNMHMFASLLGAMGFAFAWKAALILVAWSGFDYLMTWRKMETDLRMSREEIREEMKQTEGNPAIKMRIRRLRRQARKKFSVKAARTATVVVTNPTHYAVGLRYEPGMEAPVVVAKGMNLIAQQIKAIAVENGIALMENRPLAQALYKSVEVGDAIPSALYQAVADILAVVFRAQAEVRRQETLRRSRNASGAPAGTVVPPAKPYPGANA